MAHRRLQSCCLRAAETGTLRDLASEIVRNVRVLRYKHLSGCGNPFRAASTPLAMIVSCDCYGFLTSYRDRPALVRTWSEVIPFGFRRPTAGTYVLATLSQ